MSNHCPDDGSDLRAQAGAKTPRHVRGPAPPPMSGPPRVPPRPVWARVLCPSLIVALALAAYAPTLGNGFPLDDDRVVVQNRLITSLRNIPLLLTQGYWAIDPGIVSGSGGLYRPLFMISLVLNYAMGGLDPRGYHAVNLLLHAGVSLAVYGLGRRLGLSLMGATAAAAFFAVHPLHTEAVSAVVGRAELLMALGVLLALAGYASKRRAVRLGSLVAFALGCLAKEQAMVLPALLFFAEARFARQSAASPPWIAAARQALLRLLPYAGILCAYLVLRAWVLGGIERVAAVPSISAQDNPLAHVSVGPRLLTALAVAGRYLTLMLWPVSLSPDYSYNQIPLATSFLDGRVLLASLLWGSLLLLASLSFARGRGAAGFASTFALLTFLPVSNFVLPIGTIMGERLFYLPSVGLCWLAGLGWEGLWSRLHQPRLRKAAWAGLGVLVFAFTAQAVRYSQIWRDDLTLFTYAVKVAPESAKVQYDAGFFLLPLPDRKEEAIAHLRRSVEINSYIPKTWLTLGLAYLDTKRWDEAFTAFQKAIALDPKYAIAHNDLGVACANLQRSDEAVASFRRAVALKPDIRQAHQNLADIYDKKGWSEAALAERALELTPGDPLAWLQAGTTFLGLGWSAEALGAFQEAVRLDPRLPEARFRLARAYDTLDRFAEAAQAYEDLLRLRPDLPAIHRRLAELYTTRIQDPAKAQGHLRQAEGLGIRPGSGN